MVEDPGNTAGGHGQASRASRASRSSRPSIVAVASGPVAATLRFSLRLLGGPRGGESVEEPTAMAEGGVRRTSRSELTARQESLGPRQPKRSIVFAVFYSNQCLSKQEKHYEHVAAAAAAAGGGGMRRERKG